jgi:exonuclease SbcD
MSKKPADAFRVLHTADWHLGKMLNEQSREEEQKRFLDWLLKQVGRTRGQAAPFSECT